MNEYGGYFPLEIKKCIGGGYFDKIVNRCELNSARNAIKLAIREMQCREIFLPYYMCPSVYKACEDEEIQIFSYHIDSKLRPIISNFMSSELADEKACFLITNYFGLIPQEEFLRYCSEYKNLIIDNTQSFFTEPITDAYNVYSCRKFFGVSDGAYLIGKNAATILLEPECSYLHSLYLLKSLDKGTNEAYPDYLESEEIISKSVPAGMSKLTQSILSAIGYKEVVQKRRKNFEMLHFLLGDKNEFSFYYKKDMVPMVYPFLVSNSELRSYLITNKIYIPQWWKKCLDIKECNETEQRLSKYLLPLPIDQRYTEDDMKVIAKIILSFLEPF